MPCITLCIITLIATTTFIHRWGCVIRAILMDFLSLTSGPIPFTCCSQAQDGEV